MSWSYAELSKLAKENGGPEKLVDLLVNSGKKKTLLVLGVAARLFQPSQTCLHQGFTAFMVSFPVATRNHNTKDALIKSTKP